MPELTFHRRSIAVAVTAAMFAYLMAAVGAPPARAAGEIVSFGTASSAVLESGTPQITIVLTDSSPPTSAPVEVSIGVIEGSASADDYSLGSTTFTFPTDSPSGTIIDVPLTFNDDPRYEADETLVLVLTVTSGGIPGSTPSHNITILNDDANPSISIADTELDEDSGSMIFTITRSGMTDLAATAVATTTDATATNGEDFTASPTAISVPPGGDSATTTLAIPITPDTVFEPDEVFSVTLDAFGGGVVPQDLTAVGTIRDDDPPPTLTISDVSVDESVGEAAITVTRSGETVFPARATASTSGLTATGDADYTETTTPVIIAPGGATGTATVLVPINADDIDEDTESFSVTLSDPQGATLAGATATVTINDDDTAGIVVDDLDGIFVIEGGMADVFTVALTSAPTHEVTVTPVSREGEVVMDPVALTFTPDNWEDAQGVLVLAVEDGLDEADPHADTIELTASSSDPNYQGFPLADLPVSIGDSDALLVTISGPTFGAPGTRAVFTATVNAGGTGTITYQWTAFNQGRLVATGDKAVFEFTPTAGGTHNVYATVGDDAGQNPAEFIQLTVLGDIGTSTFVDDIIWLAEQGITTGCNPPDNDRFCPDNTVTRGQMAAFLSRALGLSDSGSGDLFTDDDDSIFENDIDKLATAGITRGCNDDGTQFCPNRPVTRGQMAAFLVRAFGLDDSGGGNLFTDDDDSIFENDIDKLATAGITRGCNDDGTQFCPNRTVTRGQMAAFLHRAESLLGS